MTKWHQKAMASMDTAWTDYMKGLEESLVEVEKDIEEAKNMKDQCTGEWCAATEHVLDALANSLFSIHEPTFTDDATTKKIKEMKRRLHDIYADYKTLSA